jgi:preprotein translocase subunit SecF
VVALLGIICYIRLRFETEYGSAITTQVNRTPTTPALFSMPGKLIAELSGPE